MAQAAHHFLSVRRPPRKPMLAFKLFILIRKVANLRDELIEPSAFRAGIYVAIITLVLSGGALARFTVHGSFAVNGNAGRVDLDPVVVALGAELFLLVGHGCYLLCLAISLVFDGWRKGSILI